MNKTFSWQPGERDTLLGIQKEKIKELTSAQKRLKKLTSERWVKWGEIIGLIVLFVVNFWLLSPFFGGEDRMNVFSAPLIPILAEITSILIPFSYGIRLWLLISMLLLPFSLYFFVKEISGRKLPALMTAFLVSIPAWVFLPLRLSLSIVEGDGQHIASLSIIPLACLALVKFLRKGGFWNCIIAGAGIALVALTSPLGFLVLICFAGVIAFSEMLLCESRIKVVRFAFVFVLAAGFSAFWYNPMFVWLSYSSPGGQAIRQSFANLIPPSFFIVPILGILGFLLFENRSHLQSLFLAIFWTIGFGLLCLSTGISLFLPSRFLPAFGISLSFLLGTISVYLFDFLRNSPLIDKTKIAPFRQKAAIGLIGLIFVIVLLVTLVNGADLWVFEETKILGLTADQKVGVWQIRKNISQAENIFGYLVSALTVFGTGFLKKKLGGH